MTIRICKIALVACYGLLLALVSFGNITDPGANWPFVQHVLEMDTTFRSPATMWRAIDDAAFQKAAYIAIIATETASAILVCWGVVRLVATCGRAAPVFARAKTVAVAGIALSLVLWLGGFLAIGGEWFAMWQSPTWNGAQSAARFLLAGGIVLLFLIQPDDET